MTPLGPLLLLLLGSLSRSTAQLTFNLTGPVNRTGCSQNVRLPCYVNNLKERDASVMIVDWKLGDRSVFVFDGSRKDQPITTLLSSAEMDLGLVPGGDVSLLIKNVSEAEPGRYTCDVTELNRAGSTQVQLEERPTLMFGPVEDALIGLGLVLAIVIFWIHLGISTKVLKKPMYLFLIPGVAATLLVVVGLGLLISAESSPRASAGLAIAAVGAPLALLLVQFFLSRESVEVDPKIIALTVLEAIGFLIALVGFALCAAGPCPLTRWPVLIAGIVVFVVFEFTELVYVGMKMGSRQEMT